MSKKYVIRDREAGNIIEDNLSLAEANKLLSMFEAQDEEDNIYEADFYEIVEQENI